MRQKGFAPIIIILVLALLGFLGYMAYIKGYITLSPRKMFFSPTPYPIEAKPTPTPTVVLDQEVLNLYKEIINHLPKYRIEISTESGSINFRYPFDKNASPSLHKLMTEILHFDNLGEESWGRFVFKRDNIECVSYESGKNLNDLTDLTQIYMRCKKIPL